MFTPGMGEVGGGGGVIPLLLRLHSDFGKVWIRVKNTLDLILRSKT